MADTKTELTLNGDIAIELDMLKGMLDQDATGIHTLGSRSVFTFDPGFTSIASYESKVTFIDGDEGILLHRDFPIDQLTIDSNYLKVCYVLPDGEKPTQKRYDEFETMVTRHTVVHEQITCLFHVFHRDLHPMAVTYGITDVLATFYYDSLNIDNPRHHEITTFRLLSKIPTIATICYKYSTDQPFVYPRDDLSYAGNPLNMIFSTPCEPYEISPILEHTMSHILIPHADHEQNTSTSTVRTAGSSGANPLACIAAGIASLQRPAHGGASEAALKMLEEISSVKHIPGFVHRAKDENDSFRLMGFGYRVYKNYGPRTIVIRETCHEVLKEPGTKDDLLEVTMELENVALDDPYFIEKKLYPNASFYSGIILKAMGIPSSMFTVIFAMICTVGWVTHWSEMHSGDMKTARPHQLYTRHEKHDFKSDIKR